MKTLNQPLEMIGVKRVEIILADGKIWLNADGICKIRGLVKDVVIFDKRTK